MMMRRCKLYLVFLFICLAVTSLMMVSCTTELQPDPTPQYGTLTLSQTEATIEYEKTVTLTASLDPVVEGAVYSWASEDEDVATVENGVVTGVGLGTTTITASIGDKSASASITVRAGLTLATDELELTVGDSHTIVATLNPAEGETLSYSSSNAQVASVSSSGVIEAKSAGEAAIAVTASGGASKSISVLVDVVKVAPTITLDEDEAEINLAETSTYTVQYTASGTPEPSVAITLMEGDSEGCQIEGDTITFTKGGEYEFSVSASSVAGEQSKSITINVIPLSAPVLTLNNENENVNLASDKNYVMLDYTLGGNPMPSGVSVECDELLGWSLDAASGKITFSANGEYTFTVKTSTSVGDDEDTFTVTVSGGTAAPELVVHEASKMLILERGLTYTLDFTTTANIANLEIECDKNEGFTLDEDDYSLTFSEAGEYVFTLTVAPEYYEWTAISRTVKISVVNKEVIDDDFTDSSIQKYGSGTYETAVKVEDGRFKIEHDAAAIRAAGYYRIDNFSGQFTYSSTVRVNSKDGGLVNYDMAQFVFLTYNLGANPDINFGSASNMGAAVIVRNMAADKLNVISFANGGSWVDVVGGFEFDTDHQLTIHLDTITRKYYAEFKGTTYGPFNYRSATDSNSIVYGSNKAYMNIEIDDVTLSRCWLPELELRNEDETLDISAGAQSIVLDYSVDALPLANVEVDCQSVGWSYDEEYSKIEFSVNGTYVIEVTASNLFGSVTKTFTVVAQGGITPASITINQASELLLIEIDDTYTLDYTVDTLGNPAGTLTVECDKPDGFTLAADNKSVEFSAVGVYVFTISATAPSSEWPTVSKIITVDVKNQNVLSDDFSDDSKVLKYGTGSYASAVTVDDGKLKVKYNNSSSAIRAMGYHHVPELDGQFTYSSKFKVGSAVTEEQYVFLSYANSEINVNTDTNMGIAIIVDRLNAGKLEVFDKIANTWLSIDDNFEFDVEHDLRVDFDTVSKTFYVTYDGTRTGPYTFRGTAASYKYICYGSNKKIMDIEIDDVKLDRVLAPTFTFDVDEVDVGEEIVLDGTSLGTHSGVSVTVVDGEQNAAAEGTDYTFNRFTNELIFLKEGTFTVTATGFNIAAQVVKEFTVTVVAAA